jgi:hypothetical protein
MNISTRNKFKSYLKIYYNYLYSMENINNTITFVTCFYKIKSKFNAETYCHWMRNLLLNVNHFNLVVYTNKESRKYLPLVDNSKIVIIEKNIEEFYNYQYKLYWEKNHKTNDSLNDNSIWKTDWELNMLWSEKIAFVKEVADNEYFSTPFYGWLDIGYFRNSNCNNWPDNKIINAFDKTRIYYGMVQTNNNNISYIKQQINNKTEKGLVKQTIHPECVSIAGGFFVIHKEKVPFWFHLYDYTLKNYLFNQIQVKDDQTILVDCIFGKETQDHFYIFRDMTLNDDTKWFLFIDLLNDKKDRHFKSNAFHNTLMDIY